jgi:hypothetical protein
MPEPIVAVVGWETLAAVARDLKVAGSTSRGLKNELQRALRKSGEPLKQEARAAALEELPQSGGLAEYVATETKFAIRTRLSRNPSVRIVGTHVRNVDLASMDRGRVRHLTFGHLPWRDQAIIPGWFSDRMEFVADTKVRSDILDAVDIIAAKLGGSRL